jgi:hypothetical protein
VKKSLFASVLLVLYLASATEFSQLLKLPVLVSHFREHRQHDETLSLAGFLYMHYTNHDLNDNDQDRDMQLPFKSLSGISASYQFLPAQSEIITLEQAPCSTTMNNCYQSSGLQSTYLSSIWQPPKHC